MTNDTSATWGSGSAGPYLFCNERQPIDPPAPLGYPTKKWLCWDLLWVLRTVLPCSGAKGVPGQLYLTPESSSVEPITCGMWYVAGIEGGDACVYHTC